ncbi:MAG: sodium:solute symporter [Deltaproteobacteria bacterium]|nr:sodium:solute symporter [Deltaproteobacteria bacterium]MBW2534534.1 sodium:solute symporter [Deltaproteobacteria bacterium]
MELRLATIDLGIVAAYLVVVLALGFWIARRTRTGEDLFLAGRRLAWWAVGLSLFASNISSTTLIGLSGAAYTDGIAVSNYEWGATVILVICALWVVPSYVRNRISTVPEFLERRFDRRSRVYFSGLTVVTNIVVDTAGSLYAGAMVFRLVFPELSLTTTCLLLALVAGAYTAAGGLAAVVYTDSLQAVVLLIGAAVLTWVVFAGVDFSWERVVTHTPPEMLSVIRPLDDPHLPWLGTVIGVSVLGFYFWCTNQFIVQRVLGARSVDHARWGALFGGLLKLPVLFIMVLPGTVARLVLPDIPDGDAVFPTMVAKLLPVGLSGLVLAGLLAAIMSSIDSTLNSASALVTLDFIKPRRPDLSPRRLLAIGRIAIVVFMLLAALWAPQIANYRGLFKYLQSALSFVVPPVAALFVLGLLWPRATGPAAFATLLGGHVLALGTFVGQKTGLLPDIHFTIVAGMLFFASLGICALASLRTAPPSPAQLALLSRHNETPPSPLGWWADHRVHGGLLLALCTAIVVAFW